MLKKYNPVRTSIGFLLSGIPSQFSLQSLVLPHLEYASSVWQIGNCEQLNKVQRK